MQAGNAAGNPAGNADDFQPSCISGVFSCVPRQVYYPGLCETCKDRVFYLPYLFHCTPSAELQQFCLQASVADSIHPPFLQMVHSSSHITPRRRYYPRPLYDLLPPPFDGPHGMHFITRGTM